MEEEYLILIIRCCKKLTTTNVCKCPVYCTKNWTNKEVKYLLNPYITAIITAIKDWHISLLSAIG
jgi:hypothetical protein